jgi:hypothetical protein
MSAWCMMIVSSGRCFTNNMNKNLLIGWVVGRVILYCLAVDLEWEECRGSLPVCLISE